MTPSALYSGERYVPDEIEHLAARYATAASDELARELGRSQRAVVNKANKLGLHRRPTLARCEADVRRLHAQGLSDVQIAPLVGLAKCSVVGRWRKALGLPCNMDRSKSGKAAQKVLQAKALALGCQNWPQVIALIRRKRAFEQERGCINGRQVRLCQALRLHGPLHAAAVARAARMDPGDARKDLRDLAAAGVVSRDAAKCYSFVPVADRRATRTRQRKADALATQEGG